MKKYILKNSMSIAFLLSAGQAMAQGTDSSQVFQGLSLGIAGGGGDMVSIAGSMYIGSGNYQVNGQWTIYSKNVAIDPHAQLQGTGQIRFRNLGDVPGGTSSPTFIDGNDNKIGLMLLQGNKAGLTLTNIDFPAELTRAGFVNTSNNNTLYLNNTLNLIVAGGNVHLNGNELRLGQAGGIKTDLNSRVLTDNDPSSAIIKEQVGNFIFPIGITAGDLSDVEIVSQRSQDIRVGVVDYTAAVKAGVSITAPDKGVNRAWNITNVGGASGATAELTLINNAATGVNYKDDQAFITHGQSNGTWSSSAYSDWRKKGTHMAAAIFSTSKASATAWFSKTSDADAPLSLTMGLVSNRLFNVVDNEQNVINVYPNPTTNRVHIAGLTGREKILVMDATGRTLSSLTAAGDPSASIDLSSYASGVYTIVVVDGQHRQHRSVVKQ